MQQPLITVIIPTFNRVYCVGRAIDSARTQTHQNLEIVVVDDGSSDETRDMIARTYGADPRVRYFFHENRGVTATRNRGLSLSRGEYVAWLDSDDVWLPWKLELQLACFRALPEVGMVWSDMQAVDPDGEIANHSHLRTMYGAYRWFPRNEQLFSQSLPLAGIVPHLASVVVDRRFYAGKIFSHMIMGNLVHTSTVLVRRDRLDKVGRLNEELCFSGEDYDFHLRTCRYGPVGFIDMATIRYQTGMADRLSRDEYSIHAAMNCLTSVLPFIEHARSEIDLPDRMIRRRLAEIHRRAGEKLVNAGESLKARAHLRTSLRHHFWQFRAWKFMALAMLPTRAREQLRTRLRSLKSMVGIGKKQPLTAAKAG